MKHRASSALLISLVLGTALGACNPDVGEENTAESELEWGYYKPPTGYNLHLENTLRFTPLQPGADVESGRVLFGVTSDLLSSDPTGALFEGFSAAAQRVITGNGRTCFTCHRGSDDEFGMPPPPLSASVPLTDPLFTGIDGDAQGDPRAAALLEQHALFKIRPNRFNLSRPTGDGFREVFFWRKSPSLVNLAFSHSFLNDGRGRHFFETGRGAVFSHTQDTDDRFEDLLSPAAANDLEAFSKSLFTDTRLAALLDSGDPDHRRLARRPFETVPITTQAQRRGKRVFKRRCFSCHNMPNVFANRSNVTPLGFDDLDPEFPTHGPGTGRAFNVGVAERNKHGLDFRRDLGGGNFAPIVVQLAQDDGGIMNLTVTTDIGLAATTSRVVDVGRFKVPQLRNIRNLAPYFHDNSAATLEEVIDYFDSPAYNYSADGKRFPIHLTQKQKDDLLEFLLIL